MHSSNFRTTYRSYRGQFGASQENLQTTIHHIILRSAGTRRRQRTRVLRHARQLLSPLAKRHMILEQQEERGKSSHRKLPPPPLRNLRNGAVEAWWAHNPQVGGSKPPSETISFCFCCGGGRRGLSNGVRGVPFHSVQRKLHLCLWTAHPLARAAGRLTCRH
jgi:hypothetical protein